MHLRDLELADPDNPMIRGEQRRLFHGAVGVREQEQRLGYYYRVSWRDDQVGEPVRVVFEFQQAATASQVLRRERTFGEGERSGRAEFRVVGNDYLDGGRVLAWRCGLYRGEREVASSQSYLWR